jgi:hypothetical protein
MFHTFRFLGQECHETGYNDPNLCCAWQWLDVLMMLFDLSWDERQALHAVWVNVDFIFYQWTGPLLW